MRQKERAHLFFEKSGKCWEGTIFGSKYYNCIHDIGQGMKSLVAAVDPSESKKMLDVLAAARRIVILPVLHAYLVINNRFIMQSPDYGKKRDSERDN